MTPLLLIISIKLIPVFSQLDQHTFRKFSIRCRVNWALWGRSEGARELGFLLDIRGSAPVHDPQDVQPRSPGVSLFFVLLRHGVCQYVNSLTSLTIRRLFHSSPLPLGRLCVDIVRDSSLAHGWFHHFWCYAGKLGNDEGLCTTPKPQSQTNASSNLNNQPFTQTSVTFEFAWRCSQKNGISTEKIIFSMTFNYLTGLLLPAAVIILYSDEIVYRFDLSLIFRVVLCLAVSDVLFYYSHRFLHRQMPHVWIFFASIPAKLPYPLPAVALLPLHVARCSLSVTRCLLSVACRPLPVVWPAVRCLLRALFFLRWVID